MASEKWRNASFKTYSKRVNHNVEGPALKRRRIEVSDLDVLSSEPSSLSQNSEWVDHSVDTAPVPLSPGRSSLLENQTLVNNNVDLPPLKKIRIAQALSTQSASELSSLSPKPRPGTIENFFRPIPSSSSPAPSRSIHPSSDNAESSPTPPSSPPLRSSRQPSPVSEAWAFQPKKRRRLSTKPSRPTTSKMGSTISKLRNRRQDHESDIGIPLIDNPNQEVLGGNESDRVGSDSDRSDQIIRTTNDLLSPDPLYSADAHVADLHGIDNNASVGSYLPLVASHVATQDADGKSTGFNNLNRNDKPLKDNGNQGEGHEGHNTLASNPAESDIVPLASAHATSTIPTPSIPLKDIRRKASKNFTQTVIATSTTTLKECDDCHYQYNSLIHEEVRSHHAYHENFLARKVPKSLHPSELLYMETINGKRHQIRMITRKSSEANQSWAFKVLRLTQDSLGDLDTVDRYSLWSKIARPDFPEDPNHVPRYRVYVYLVGDTPVSVVLAEHVKEGGAWISDEKRVSVTTRHQVMMCVDRVWTEGNQMRKGYASKVLDCARDSFVVGMRLEKEKVSFSVPTVVGEAFARKYCRGVFPSAAFVVSA